MICPKCGKDIQLSDDSRFCPGCGLEFTRQSNATPQPQQQPSQLVLTEEQANVLKKVERELDIKEAFRESAVPMLKLIFLVPLAIMGISILILILMIIF